MPKLCRARRYRLFGHRCVRSTGHAPPHAAVTSVGLARDGSMVARSVTTWPDAGRDARGEALVEVAAIRGLSG